MSPLRSAAILESDNDFKTKQQNKTNIQETKTMHAAHRKKGMHKYIEITEENLED